MSSLEVRMDTRRRPMQEADAPRVESVGLYGSGFRV